MNTKHTPGPWIATGWENTVVNIPDIYSGGHLTICVYPASGQAPRSEAVANARLIAAAPDMAAEISKQIDWLKHARAELQGVARESLLLGFAQSIKYLSAALAKATGKAA